MYETEKHKVERKKQDLGVHLQHNVIFIKLIKQAKLNRLFSIHIHIKNFKNKLTKI